jgi:hypothetical protein
VPYISDTERERARWMTLAEAIAHIAKHDGCDRRSALKQLRDALGDRKLRIKWDTERLRLNPYIVYAHRPPESASSWKQARIRGAKVFDPETETWRTLLIHKDDIFQLDLGSALSAASESGKAESITKAKVGRHSIRNEFDQAYDRLWRRLGHRVQEMAPTELAGLIAKECGKKLGDRGWAPRTMLQHIQRLRAEH